MKRIFQKKGTVQAARKKATAPKHRDAADEQAATELVVYIENTSDLSPDGPHGQGHSVLLNALRKWRKGTYNPELAVRLFGYLVESGAKRYAKEMGSSEKEWSTMFTPATRHEAAQQLEASFRNSAENGEYDHVDTRTGGAREITSESHVRGDSFTPKLSGNYVGRRVEIRRVAWKSASTYFKAGQFGYVVGQDQRGGCSLMDAERTSEPGEVALLVSKTRDMRGGALWFSLEGVRFTGKETHEAGSEEARRPQQRKMYPYGQSASGQYTLTRDGKEIMRGTEQEIWAWMHRNLGYSIDHALTYEGYAIAPTSTQEAPRARRRSR